MIMKRIGSSVAAILLSGTIALAANTIFFTNIGDLTFPFKAPLADGTAGTIDNMTIGATTKRAATVTTLTADTIAGAGITANFASPPPIGNVAPNTGAFTSVVSNSLTANAAANATAPGSNEAVAAGAGGATSGAGGIASLSGGAGSGGNANGGDVNLMGGAANGSGVNGVVRVGGVELKTQGAPAAATTSATLTAANVLTGIITVNQGAAGASAQQLPLASAMDTALPTAAAGDAFDFSVINISTNAAESASLTTNTGWTLVGDMDVSANSAATTKSAGRFRARKTGTGAWTLYRLS